MTAPRLNIDLDKIFHNARMLVERLTGRGISVTGVTKATLGSPEIAAALLRAGVCSIGDSRIENIETMRRASIRTSMTLVRSPMLSQATRVVAHSDVSLNTELNVIRKLSQAAQEATKLHGVILMVELGDLREGIMPSDLVDIVRKTLRLPNIAFKGIGTNLACRSGVSPDEKNMAQLSALATLVEDNCGHAVEIVSGGNSANLQWAFGGASVGRVNDLRLGESILLGREPLQRKPIDGLHTNAITLSAEVIESKVKPSQPWGTVAQSAFVEKPLETDRGDISQLILAIGQQDTDPFGLAPPPGIEVLGASSDHLILASAQDSHNIGAEITFQLNYSSLVRAMTSPFVEKVVNAERG
ncbi:MAG: alanine/ornithine racemase family PLP-dependent enzyme [Planctomycetales bacterium]|nr:alanine/ornithine racemase family PLP-dependent enzyme [Planctomycetales bacterium]